MALPVRDQAKYWGIAIAVFLLALWALGDVILPFVLGGAIAYLLDPVADRLEKLGLTRVLSVAVITVIGLFLFLILVLLVFPTLIQQSIALAEAAPALIDSLQATLTERFPQLLDADSTIRLQLDALGTKIQSQGGTVINGLLSSAMGLINIIVLLVVVPVVAFYLLLDWDNMVAKIDDMLPRDHAPIVRQLASQVDTTLASFIRGQGTVCLALGSYYAIALMIAGLNFGLVVGVVAGLISFIPYIGALVGGALAIGLALFQFWGDWVSIGIIAGIFVVGQFLEGNILTPKLVGQSVGLHPVWLIFALSVFGSLFGFVGMLVAVPMAAMIGVFARYGISQYRESLLYRGLSDADE
ncbi:MAG: AI-2E family transporter [Loktanella sp.]|jgi:predicted PurR-regulated permease PerM|nr:AI-2E family transporter [Loktanella sp.]MDO7607263.1 AI-2E family transporter [Loktanella sp.]MDO7623090.1 AI-2E family transporter [Loktanella sp.]MDO7625739.1 AI-2E family transporter [Loktanella sp.]MDO7630155.1 AI-2E family transporter [Loktanella sp.]